MALIDAASVDAAAADSSGASVEHPDGSTDGAPPGSATFVAAGPRVYVSGDGRRWQQVTAAPSLGAVQYGGGRFVGYTSQEIWYSEDGRTWESTWKKASAAEGDVKAVALGAEAWLAARQGDNFLVSTDRGASWTSLSDRKPFEVNGLSGAGSTFLAVVRPASGQRYELWRSADAGKTWQTIRLPTTPARDPYPMNLLGHFRGRFVVTAPGGFWYESTDGASWTFVNLYALPDARATYQLGDILYMIDIGKVLIAHGIGTSLVASDDNGNTWRLSGGIDGRILAFGGGVFVGQERNQCKYHTDLTGGPWRLCTFAGDPPASFTSVAYGVLAPP